MKVIAILLVSCLISSSVFAAECARPVTPLKEGEQAPCTGFLFTSEKEKEVRLKGEDYKSLLEQSELLIKQKEFYKKELEESDIIIKKEQEKSQLWQKSAEEYAQKYISTEEHRGMRDWFFLIGGVVLTIGAGFAVGQANK